MLLIEDPRSTDPAFNLALEEHLLMNLPMDQDYLLLYVNRPSIVIGKHQNAVEEINTDHVEEHRMPVLRRQSGGGTVYHDLGNLNFSFIRRYEPKYFNNYDHFTGLVAEALRRMRVPATLNERGDIYVEGKKVSGNAQAVRRDRMVSHGTLLFRSRLEDVSQALRTKPGKISSKGRPSVRSQVTNIGNYLPAGMDMEAFRGALLGRLFPDTELLRPYMPGAADLQAAAALADGKYRTWEWNYGQSPNFDLERDARLGASSTRVRLHVEKGTVQEAELHAEGGDAAKLERLGPHLVGVKYRPEDLHAALAMGGASSILPGATIRDWVRLLY
ncbi:MAG TPA: lipoate--protein ligase [Flavobacteriales bacterium]|nr:lipoate--protein ligase [Flavobacteriales bacterium]